MCLAFVWMCLACLVLAGCAVEPQERSKPSTKTISGVLADVQMCPEDRSYTTFILKFKDGRLHKCRAYYTDVFTFKIGQPNDIEFDSWGTIKSVKYAE